MDLQLAALTVSAWIAQTQPVDPGGGGDTNWVTYLLNGGPFAIVLLLIILDKIGTHAERDRLRIENKELRDKNETLNNVLREEVVPPLTELNRLMAEVLRALDTPPEPPAPRQPRRPRT